MATYILKAKYTPNYLPNIMKMSNRLGFVANSAGNCVYIFISSFTLSVFKIGEDYKMALSEWSVTRYKPLPLFVRGIRPSCGIMVRTLINTCLRLIISIFDTTSLTNKSCISFPSIFPPTTKLEKVLVKLMYVILSVIQKMFIGEINWNGKLKKFCLRKF